MTKKNYTEEFRRDAVEDALGAAALTRGDLAGAVFHADCGSQGVFNRSKQHVAVELIVGVRPKLQRG
ncbi:hypothetical protein, partial [Rhodococcus erythropolis]|uniref:hypothetical protein n=1 Tax=Rhodococcus erythropolis TaxID=1833 RepID=UPI00265DAB2C